MKQIEPKQMININEMGIKATIEPSENGYKLTVLAQQNLQITNLNKELLGDISITISKEKAQRLLEEGKIDEETINTLLEMFRKHEEIIHLSRNPDTPQKIIAEKIQIHAEDTMKQTALMRYLISIKHLIEEEDEANRMIPLFKKNVDQKNAFGIPKPVMDRLQYLPELLETAMLHDPDTEKNITVYTICASIPSKSKKGVGPIGLEYRFNASDRETAETVAKKYLLDMCSGALKVLLAYWAYANDVGAFCFVANTSDIIAIMNGNEARTTYVESSEKERFWHLSKLLEDTKLTLTINNNNEKIVVRHRLLDIKATTHGNWQKMGEKKKSDYPLKIQVRVLNPEEFQEKANIATEISKGTIKLRSEDIMLALTIEIRGAQIRGSSGMSSYDEGYLVKRANLQKTYSANPRMGRKRLSEKLNRIQEAKVMDQWQTSNGKISILHRKNKNKEDSK